MGRSQVWNGAEWVSMTGGAGDGGGGGEADDTYLRLDGSNNPASPNNYLRTTDADSRYLQLTGGTISGALSVTGGATISGTLNAQGASLSTALDSTVWPLFVAIPDSNDTRIWLGSRRYAVGGDHNSSQALITRKVDATWSGGLAISSGGTTLYAQFDASGPYKPATFAHLTTSAFQVSLGALGIYDFRSDPRTEDNAGTVRNVLIGTGVPSNAWGRDGDIYIQHQA